MDDLHNLLEGPAFAGLESERKAYMAELFAQLRGKGTMESIAILARAKLPEGREFTEEERDAMIEAALSGVDPAERAKMKRMIELAKSL